MTKQKSTKRALLMSALALLMCVSMLIGSTFAWFTDTAISGSNVIKSGTLDVKMSYLAPQTESDGRVWENFLYYYQYPDDAQWVDVESDKAQPIFNYQKWEPGYTDCAYLMIENEGNLNLRYCLSIVPTGEVGKLAEVIDVYYQVYYQATTKDRWGGYNKGDWLDANDKKTTPNNIWYDNMTEGSKYAGTLQDIIDGKFTRANDQTLYSNEFTGTMFNYTPQGRVYYAIALHMREDAGNEYQNQSIGDAFDVRLIATQAIGEMDMYNNMYDAKAEYPTVVGNATDLKAAIANGGEITLSGTADLGGGKGAYLNLSGKTVTITGGTIKGVGNDGELNSAVKANSGNIVFDGVTFELTDEDIKTGSWGMVANISGTANVTFKNCTFKGSQCPIYQSGSAAVVTLENCKFESTVGMIQCEIYSGDFSLGQDLIIKNCDFTGMTDVLHIYDYDKDPSSDAIAQYLKDNGNTFTGTCKQTCTK